MRIRLSHSVPLVVHAKSILDSVLDAGAGAAVNLFILGVGGFVGHGLSGGLVLVGGALAMIEVSKLSSCSWEESTCRAILSVVPVRLSLICSAVVLEVSGVMLSLASERQSVHRFL